MSRRALPTVILSVICACAVNASAQDKASLIARARSAAPAAIGARAAVVDMDDHGGTTALAVGDNGWTCMPNDPGTPVPQPVCVDRNGLAWFEAAMAGRPPDPAAVGYAYMLKGGTAWSFADPAATKLPEGEREAPAVGPHIMLLSARLAADSGFPSGAHPDLHRPFVAYAGTAYALVIIPVN